MIGRSLLLCVLCNICVCLFIIIIILEFGLWRTTKKGFDKTA